MAEDLVFPGLILAGLVLTAGAFYAIWNSENDWERFQIEHNCKKISHIEGDVINSSVLNANGSVSNAVTVTPDKTGFLCDDGVTYYR